MGVKVSQLPLIYDIKDQDVFMINNDNVITSGIEVSYFVESLVSRDLTFTGGIYFDGTVTLNSDVNFLGEVEFFDKVTINNGINFNNFLGIRLGDLDDVVYIQNLEQGDVLVYNASISSWVNSNSFPVEVFQDKDPRLGGNLDTNGYRILTKAGQNITLAPGGSNDVDVIGNSLPAGVRLYSDTNNNFIRVQCPQDTDFLSGSYTLTLPDKPGTFGQYLTSDGVGRLIWGDLNSNDDSGIDLTDLSVDVDDTGSENGNLSYNNATGVFTYTPVIFTETLTSAMITQALNNSTDFDEFKTNLLNILS